MIRRAIGSSLGRFAAIFAISALGVGFLAGIASATPDMALSGSRYYEKTNFADFRLLSNIGFDMDDLYAVLGAEGVESAVIYKTADLLFEKEDGMSIGVTVRGLSGTPLSDSVNTLSLSEGRLPENEGECLAESTVSPTGHLKIGDKITLSRQNSESALEEFTQKELTVVGMVENPFYMSMQRESTTVGTGQISDIIYVLESCFDTDYYTEIFVKGRGLEGLVSQSDEYDEKAQPIFDGLESLADYRQYIRHDKVVTEARAEIDDGWSEYYEEKEKAERELSDALSDLEDGERELSDGWREYYEGKESGYNELLNAEQDIRDGWQEYYDGQKDYEEGKQEFEDAKVKYLDGQEEYNEGRAELDKRWQEYYDGEKEYEEGYQQYLDGKAELEEAELRLKRAENQISMGYDSYYDGYDELRAQQQLLDDQAAAAARAAGLEGIQTASQLISLVHSDPMLEAAFGGLIAPLEEGQAQIDTAMEVMEDSLRDLEYGEESLAEGRKELEDGKAELEKARRTLLDSRLTLDDAKRQLSKGEEEMQKAEQELIDGYRELEDGYRELLDAEQELNDAFIELKDGERELTDGWVEYDSELRDGYRELSDAEQELIDGWQDYYSGKEEAERELKEAELELLKAEADLRDMDEPKWYVLDRSSMITSATFQSNIEKVASIAKVFPVFFFIIAALVCLTTMTRMVDEERGVIGTMKALGYRTGEISAKYLIYAAAASLLGCALGLGVGLKLFPAIIWNAYGIMYRLPRLYTPFNIGYALYSTLPTIACTMGAAGWACFESMRESSASLMLPKAPAPGKRVFLERIGFIWKRLSFNHKVTARNIFRYKKRFFMTVTGITGCTALLLTGFGLRDSISGILYNQYTNVWQFDLMVGLKPEEMQSDGEMKSILDQTGESMIVMQESGTAVNGKKTSEVSIMVPSDPDAFKSYVSFKERVGGRAVGFNEGSAVITEKAADTLGIKAGDTITLRDADDNETEIEITGITENYIQGYIYIAPDVYQSSFGEDFEGNMALCKSRLEDPSERDALAEKLLKCPSCASVTFTRDTWDSLQDTFKSIDMIVVVLIICAGLLAFVVLYNLTNININERIKEIATLKVLGFYPSEVSAYVLRETNMLSFIGGIFGLFAGKLLHAFVARTAEVDMVMFGRVIEPQSYVYSLGLTMLFSLFVSLVMTGKLRDISMVDSLKAPE